MKQNKLSHFLFYLLVIGIFSSCTNIVPKSHTISSIKNKGVIINKDINYPRVGILVIQTKNDIVSEEIGNIDREPLRSIFNILQEGDTLK